MNCTEAQERFADVLDGRLPEAGTAEVRTHLASCPDCQREYSSLAQTLVELDALPAAKPGPALRQNFYAMLEEEKNSAASIAAAAARHRHHTRASVWRWILAPAGAGVLALGGFLLGSRYAQPVPGAGMDPATKQELADLRARVDSVGQMVGISLLQQRSTSERLQSVLATLDQKNPDQKVISDLIGSLALDPSTNVRLSALDALYPHAGQPIVRSGVLATLPREQNPLVQVAMIDFLVAARDREAVPELERIVRNETADRVVRDAAQRGLAQL
ncbi:MAG: anti-ECFsigma factor, ChrR [Verrucomicrobia bacterium]|nr:anti-ECFsigma factor, ChrR [Verrucomicrobiota bacterium]